jgi:hypothetical protein
MSARNKILAAVAGFTLLGGIGVAGAVEAQASTTGCAFSNGCATLHGTDAASDTVAMDTKYQNKNEIVIGYPDNAGDNATSFDAVLHYGKGAKVTSYADTGLQVSNLHLACSLSGVGPSDIPLRTGTTITAPYPLTVAQAHGTNFTTTGPSTSLSFSGTLETGTVVTETGTGNDAGCAGAFTYNGTVFQLSSPTSLIGLSYPGGSVTEFTDSDTGTFAFTGLPAGITPAGGALTADTSTAHPGTYSSVGVTFTESNGAAITEAFELVVSGIKSVTPGAGVPFYTFVYAPKGTWSDQCVTDINGSGALKLYPCTEGKDTGQDFTVGATTPGLLSSSQAPVRNLLAEAANPADSYLTDPSTSNPATPQSDAADERAPGGRQLYVNGTDTNLWSWGT